MKSLAIESALLSAHNKTTEQIIPQLVSVDRNISQTDMDKTGNGGVKQVKPKDLVDILDKIGKIVRSD